MSVTTKLQFKNGNAYPVISINALGILRIQGLDRPVIDAQFAENAYAAIKAELAVSGNTDELTIIEEAKTGEVTTVTSRDVHNNFSIIQELASPKKYLVSPATDTAAEINENRTSLVLAQLTYLEVNQKSQQKTIDALLVASLEG